jgi:ParB/RepB/Spo0J family partition protein
MSAAPTAAAPMKKSFKTKNQSEYDLGISLEDKESAQENYLSLHDIYIDRTNNARPLDSEHYSEASINELASRIKATRGLLQPIIVVEVKPSSQTDMKKYLLISGFRRCAALEVLAEQESNHEWITKVYAKVVSLTTHSAYKVVQLFENLRENLGPLDVARTLQDIIDESNNEITQAELAGQTGFAQSTISRYLRLISLPETVKDMIKNETIPLRTALLIVSDTYVIDKEDYTKLAKLAEKYQYDTFKAMLDSNYSKEKVSKETTDAVKIEKGKKTLSHKHIERYYKKYIVDKIRSIREKLEKIQAGEEEDTDGLTSKKFTEEDVLLKIQETFDTILGEETELVNQVKPIIEAEKQKETEKKANEGKEVNFKKFIKSQAKKINSLLQLPVNPETGERPFPSVAKASIRVITDIRSMKEEEIKKLEFDFDISKLDEYAKLIINEYTNSRKQAIETAKKKKKKEEEKKAKEKEEGTTEVNTESDSDKTPVNNDEEKKTATKQVKKKKSSSK